MCGATYVPADQGKGSASAQNDGGLGSLYSTVQYMYDRSSSPAQNRFAPNKHALCKAVLYSKGSILGQIL